MNARPSRSVAKIGATSAAAVVVANMIGAGVFTTSGFALADLQSPARVLLAWLVGGGIALCGALCYGALGRHIPVSGGEYTFLSRLVHPLAGFLAGWVSLLAGFTAPIAAAALGLQAYLLGEPETAAALALGGLRPEWLGTGAIVGAGLIHGLRLREGVWVQNLAVALKLAAIATFVAIGASTLPDAAPGLRAAAITPPPFDPGSFAVTLVWISFAYSGWNAAVYLASEIDEPRRNLPRALVLATVVVTFVYLALNAVFLYAAPLEALAGRADIGAVAAEALGGRALRTALSALVALALFTSITSMVMAGPRVYQRMASDGLFPHFLAGASARGSVPRRAIALQVGLAVALVWNTRLIELLGAIGFTLGLSAAVTVTALVAARWREGAERVPIPGHPWVPAIYVLCTTAASAFMAQREPRQALFALLAVAAGVPLYFLAARAHTGTR